MPKNASAARQSLDRLAELQDAVVTRRQLRVYGYDLDAVRAQIDARRWQSHGREVVVLHNGPLTMRQAQWVGVLAQHRGALAGLTAAQDLGLSGFDDPLVHVLIAYDARRHRCPASSFTCLDASLKLTSIRAGRYPPSGSSGQSSTPRPGWCLRERRAPSCAPRSSSG